MLKYQVHKFTAHHNIDKTICGEHRYYSLALVATLRENHIRGTIYAIFDAWNNKYMRFFHNYHPVDNPTGNIEILKSGSY